MGLQGRALTEDQFQRIVCLLSETDMAVGDIADRMRCSRSTVLAINRKCKIRGYFGQRTKWQTLKILASETSFAETYKVKKSGAA